MDSKDLDKSPDPQAKIIKSGVTGPRPENMGTAPSPAPGGFAGGTNDAAQRSTPDPDAPGSAPAGPAGQPPSNPAEHMFDDDSDVDPQEQFHRKYSHVRLDRTRDFGIVAGEADGAVHVQDGLYFDAFDRLIQSDWLHPKSTLDRLDKRGKQDWARAKADAFYEQLMNEDPRMAPGTLAAEQEPQNQKLDLGDWAKGKVQVRFDEVRNAAKEQYGYTPGSARAMVGFLIDRGVIKRSDITPGGATNVGGAG